MPNAKSTKDVIAATTGELRTLLDFLLPDGEHPSIAAVSLASGEIGLQHFVSSDVKDVDESKHEIKHLISTPRVDYVKDVMDPFGAITEPIDKNRAVFYNHQIGGSHDLPIGKNVWLQKTKQGVLALTRFAVDENKFAADVYRLSKSGYLPSWSIGFIPKTWEWITQTSLAELTAGKFDIPNLGDYTADDKLLLHRAWMLYEYSKVGVPMNMDALDKIAKGIAAGLVESDYGRTYFGGLVGRERLAIVLPTGGGLSFEIERAKSVGSPSTVEVTVGAYGKTTTPSVPADVPLEVLPNEGTYIIEDGLTLDAWTKARSTTVQSVICMKEVFSREAASKWVGDHGYKNGKVDETEDSFRFRQFEPSMCAENSYRTIDLTKGVKAVICKKKELELEEQRTKDAEALRQRDEAVDALNDAMMTLAGALADLDKSLKALETKLKWIDDRQIHVDERLDQIGATLDFATDEIEAIKSVKKNERPEAAPAGTAGDPKPKETQTVKHVDVDSLVAGAVNRARK